MISSYNIKFAFQNVEFIKNTLMIKVKDLQKVFQKSTTNLNLKNHFTNLNKSVK